MSLLSTTLSGSSGLIAKTLQGSTGLLSKTVPLGPAPVPTAARMMAVRDNGPAANYWIWDIPATGTVDPASSASGLFTFVNIGDSTKSEGGFAVGNSGKFIMVRNNDYSVFQWNANNTFTALNMNQSIPNIPTSVFSKNVPDRTPGLTGGCQVRAGKLLVTSNKGASAQLVVPMTFDDATNTMAYDTTRTALDFQDAPTWSGSTWWIQGCAMINTVKGIAVSSSSRAVYYTVDDAGQATWGQTINVDDRMRSITPTNSEIVYIGRERNNDHLEGWRISGTGAAAIITRDTTTIQRPGYNNLGTNITHPRTLLTDRQPFDGLNG